MKARALVSASLLAAGLLVGPPAATAQQKAPTAPKAKIYRIGALGATTSSAYQAYVDALRQEFGKLGYVEGKNVVVEARWAEGNYDRLPDMAAELVRLKVDIIITHGAAAIGAAKKATRTIPIVMAVVGDAVAAGIVTNVVRPGGNITGSTFFWSDVQAKRLRALRDALPGATRVAVLANPDSPNFQGKLRKITELDALSLGLVYEQFEARGPDDFEGAFSAAEKWRADAVLVPEDAVFISHAERIADLAVQHHFRTVGFTEYAETGGLVGFGVDLVALWRRAAWFADKILRGSKPGDLPIEQPVKYDLTINLKTAKTLEVEIPEVVLHRADRIIE